MPLITTDASRPVRDAFLKHLGRFDNEELIDYVSVEDNSGIDGGGGGGFVDSEYLANLSFQKTNANDFLDSCNGLFLFFNSFDLRYYVCNPVMKQYVPIPKARRHQQRHCYAALAFNPSESLCYRVVRIARCKMKNKLVLDVYCSNTEQWVRHRVQIDSCINGRSWVRHAVYFHGALYQLSLSKHLLRFDLNEVGVHAVELPLTESANRNLIGCIGVLMGRLCYGRKTPTMLFIWSLEGDCKAMEWALKYRIDMASLINDLVLSKGLSRSQFLWFQPFAFHPTSDVIFLSIPLRILSYDLKRQTLEEVCKPRDGVIVTGRYYPGFTCFRLLVSLNRLGKIQCRSTQLTSVSQDMNVLSLEMPPNEIPNEGA